LGGQGSLTGHSFIGPCGSSRWCGPRQSSGRTSGSRASLPKPSPLRTGRDNCSSSGSSLCRPVTDPHVVRMVAPPVYQSQVVQPVSSRPAANLVRLWASCTPRRRRRLYSDSRSAGRAVLRIWSGPGASAGSSPAVGSRPPRHGRSDPAVASRPPPPQPKQCRTTPSAPVRRSVRFAPSNVSSDPKLCTSSQPLRPWRKSAPFRVGYPLVAEALSAPLQGGLRLLRRSSTPSAIPSLAVRIPPLRSGGTGGAYPVVQWGDADGEAASFSPTGHSATVVDRRRSTNRPACLLAPAYQHLWPAAGHGP